MHVAISYLGQLMTSEDARWSWLVDRKESRKLDIMCVSCYVFNQYHVSLDRGGGISLIYAYKYFDETEDVSACSLFLYPILKIR